MEPIETKDVLCMVATMCAGIFANTATGHLIIDRYNRQQIIQQMIWDVTNAVKAAGITIKEK
jgi:hypothetical protein